jgi:hypothetical protein
VDADLNPFETPREMHGPPDGEVKALTRVPDGQARLPAPKPPAAKKGAAHAERLKGAMRKVSAASEATGMLDQMALGTKAGWAAPPPAAAEQEKASLTPWAAGHAAQQKVEASGFALPPELQLKPCEELPYESLEVLINAENVWANIQAYNVTSLGFDLTDETRWHPFIVPKVYDPPPPRPFYSTSKVAAKLPEQRLAALTATLATKLRAEYTSWRLTRSMRMRFNSKVQSVLEEGLALLEQARCSSSSTAQMEVDKWRGRLMAAAPPDHRFRGRALTFSTTDVDEIVEHIMTTYPYHEEGHRDATFAIAIATFPHYCAAPRRTAASVGTGHGGDPRGVWRGRNEALWAPLVAWPLTQSLPPSPPAWPSHLVTRRAARHSPTPNQVTAIWVYIAVIVPHKDASQGKEANT